jgi:hypothetical protein
MFKDWTWSDTIVVICFIIFGFPLILAGLITLFNHHFPPKSKKLKDRYDPRLVLKRYKEPFDGETPPVIFTSHYGVIQYRIVYKTKGEAFLEIGSEHNKIEHINKRLTEILNANRSADLKKYQDALGIAILSIERRPVYTSPPAPPQPKEDPGIKIGD